MKYKITLAVLITMLMISSVFAGAINTKSNIDKKLNIHKKAGDILYVGGIGPGNYSKIQDAIENASDGDTIFVYNGTYYENVKINKTITLIGENKDNTTIDGSNNYNVIEVWTDRVNISGFIIQNSGDYFGIEAGIRIRSNYTTIENNKIKYNYQGIRLQARRENTTKKNTIKGNLITKNSDIDILCLLSNNNIICENYFIEDSYEKGGIVLLNSNNNTIYENDFSGKFLSNLQLQKSKNNTIYNNSFTGGFEEGIYITEESNENNIHHNNITNIKTWGILIEDSNYNNIHHNNFIKCRIKARFLRSSFNKWHQNYWGRPRILPKPIFGRKGIFLSLIPWVNFDWRPAREPYEI